MMTNLCNIVTQRDLEGQSFLPLELSVIITCVSEVLIPGHRRYLAGLSEAFAQFCSALTGLYLRIWV